LVTPATRRRNANQDGAAASSWIDGFAAAQPMPGTAGTQIQATEDALAKVGNATRRCEIMIKGNDPGVDDKAPETETQKGFRHA